MKKYEVVVEDSCADELADVLKGLPYVREFKESPLLINAYTLASEQSLSNDWLSDEDDELEKLHHP